MYNYQQEYATRAQKNEKTDFSVGQKKLFQIFAVSTNFCRLDEFLPFGRIFAVRTNFRRFDKISPFGRIFAVWTKFCRLDEFSPPLAKQNSQESLYFKKKLDVWRVVISEWLNNFRNFIVFLHHKLCWI